ncbi:hypothetical protein PFICI_13204 [Pestalotiopsis fici W106-1]|uniref:Xylanolytic transcriptional activator regulatory domain-containing protein n=1 Tax=Pestalotiopsis fici (strain W106-1 / CGMCC3.15140) TaxID=1229662 RepID=W3WLF6_PESFW|nr:uncharacterized protein PFICI_13204 [Pestalotiopsis fici W106-1]ETS74720.1 hypothetical protein PFICI_13204 [Pestalotiopsis fici W106-1]
MTTNPAPAAEPEANSSAVRAVGGRAVNAYIEELERRASHRSASSQPGVEDAHQNSSGAISQSPGAQGQYSPTVDAQPDTSSQPQPVAAATTLSTACSHETSLTNPLTTGQSTFMSADDGTTLYLGTSSNWSFTQKTLNMVYEHVFHENMPLIDRVFEGQSYDLGWSGKPAQSLTPPALPDIDHAIHLIDTVKFYCGQMFHLFDHDTFMPALHEFYKQPGSASLDELWYIHLLLILAFGKAFKNKRRQGKCPAGAEFFVNALQRLPHMIMLWRYPLQAVEILTCIALYLQCIDYRIAAHNYIGQAMRLALGHGLHTDMPAERIGVELVERSRRAWWTVYILDREMTSTAGVPQSIHDDDVHPQLPKFSGLVQPREALRMRIRLSQVTTDINRTIYGVDGKLNSKFLDSTRNVLAKVAKIADDLHRLFPIRLEPTAGGLSRISAHLHLHYHRSIILATRPLLYCFLKIRLESPLDCSAKLEASETTRNLIEICVDSSMQTLMILCTLLAHDLLDSVLPFDLESASMAAIIIMIASTVDASLIVNGSDWLQKARSILGNLYANGNELSMLHISELKQLGRLLAGLNITPSHTTMGGLDEGSNGSVPYQNDPRALFVSMTVEPSLTSIGELYNAAMEDTGTFGSFMANNIMDLVNSIDDIDRDWMPQTMAEYDIW